MSNFKIEVVKPNKGIVLNFRSFEAGRGKYMLEISDKHDRNTCISFSNVGENITSTLLSRWVNYYLANELKLLAGLGSSYEIMKKGMKNDWKFRNNVTYFGLHDLLHKSGDVHGVRIDDSIGMRNVVAILGGLGYTVETSYDKELKRMIEIKLIKESFL